MTDWNHPEEAAIARDILGPEASIIDIHKLIGALRAAERRGLERAKERVQAEAGKIHAMNAARNRGEVAHALPLNEAARLDSLAAAIEAMIDKPETEEPPT